MLWGGGEEQELIEVALNPLAGVRSKRLWECSSWID